MSVVTCLSIKNRNVLCLPVTLKSLLQSFFQYLLSISTKSSSLLREKYAPVFEVLNNAAVFSRGETNEDRLAQMLVDMQEGNEEAGSGENESEQET